MSEKYKGFLPRLLFGKAELDAVKEVFKNSWSEKVDFGYQGRYESQLCDNFNEYLGGNGYVDAVSSGTAGIYISLKALGIGSGDEVAVSPITSPGGITPVIEVGATLSLIDSKEGTNLVNLEQVKKSITEKTKAILLTHAGGYPIFDLQEIAQFAKKKGIFFIEDCSQAHGAEYGKKKVGTFSDIAVWSTMFSKTLSTGGSGGLIYTEDEGLYRLIRAYADRGKDFNITGASKDPDSVLFPALNFNLDELSCAIGTSVLSKLDLIVNTRRKILKRMIEKIGSIDGVNIYTPCLYSKTSPFYIPVIVDEKVINKSKKDLAYEIKNSGIPLNPHYKEVVADWPWITKHITGIKKTPNANSFRDSTFNLYIHEKYVYDDINRIELVLSRAITGESS